MRSAALLLAAAALAFARQLPIRVYTTADGLAGGQIRRVVRDSRGYLWFCTNEGLSRFDGYRFVNYGTEDGLPNNTIFDIVEGPGGRWWVATQRGLAEFHPATAPRFTLHPLAEKKNGSVRRLLIDRRGQLWVGAYDGLFRQEGDGFAAVDFGAPDEYAGSHVTSLLEDRHGALWIGARSGLYRRWPNGRVERYTTSDGLPYKNVEALAEDKAGRLWVGTRRGLCLVRNSRGGRAVIENAFTARDGLREAGVWALLEGSDARLWAATADGLVQILFEPGHSRPRFVAFTRAHGLRNSVCVALAEDVSGNLWIGTEGGAARLVRAGFSMYAEADGLTNRQVVSVFESRDGRLQAATRRGKLFLHPFEGERFAKVRPGFPALRDEGWTAGQIVLQSRAGEWWFATGDGLIRFPRTDRVEQLTRLSPKSIYRKQHGLAGDGITILFEDSRGDIWFQSEGLAEVGWHRWEAAKESLHSYSAGEIGIVPTDLNALVEDRAGNLWMAFSGSQLVRYRDGRFRAWGGRDGIPPGSITSLYVDHTGRLWAGSSESGLLRIDNPAAGGPRVAAYARRQGLSGNSVYSITEDRWGRIYACTGLGVDRLDPASSEIEHFTLADGLRSESVNLAFRDRNGALWFATGEGLARFDPEPPTPRGPLPILVSGVRIRGIAHAISELGQGEVALPDLPAAQNQIQIDFTSLNFAPGEIVSYQYRLEGADRDWNGPTTLRTLNYASLKPGHYRFLVRALGAGGRSSTRAATVDFAILPPVWARWWFQAAAVAALGLAGYGLHRLRVRQLLALERVRTHIAADLHDDIGASLSQIAILSEVARSRLDRTDSRAAGPLAEVASISGELVDSMSDMVWAINPKHDRLSDLVHRVRRFAGDLLGGRDIALRFQAPDGADDPLLGPATRRQFFLIAKEAVNNIARHSGATEVDIEFELGAGCLALRVRDNGRGFDEAASRHGNGLANMRRRAAMLGGGLELRTSPGEGAALTVTAPL